MWEEAEQAALWLGKSGAPQARTQRTLGLEGGAGGQGQMDLGYLH